jgi:hypothetical protein
MYQDASPCRLFGIARRKAAGWGTEIAENEASRSGFRAATPQPTAF